MSVSNFMFFLVQLKTSIHEIGHNSRLLVLHIDVTGNISKMAAKIYYQANLFIKL